MVRNKPQVTAASLLEWVISTYENHPDSPFKESEIIEYKKQLNGGTVGL